MSTQYKRTNWVRRLEDFSSGCSSGFGLGQWLIAGILATFSGISRLLPVTRWLSVTLSPDVPVVSTVGASSLKSPASIWRGVVFVVLVVGLMAMGRGAWAFSCADVTQIPKTECEALVDFYNSTNGDNWKDNTGWNKTNTPCSWYGVSCEDGHVTYLSLSNNQLSGSIPDLLGNLSNLTHLHLSNNQLSGSIPESLSNLSNLQILYLFNNQLSGSIPESLGKLSNLDRIDLGGNQLSGSIPDSLGNLSGLMSLHLGRNQLSGLIPESLGNLSYLGSIQLHHNQLSGSIPESLSNLNYLRSLRLQNNQLIGPIPESLGNLSNLHSLYLNNNQLSGSIPESLGKLSKLEYLYLNSNQLSGSIPESFGNLSNLGDIRLEWNQLSGSIPESLGNLSNLRQFYLTQNELCGDIPLSLMNLNISYKVYFRLQNNHLTASSPELITWLNDNAEWGEQTACPTSKFSCSDVTEIPKSECEALVALYESTDGDNWKDNTGWKDTNTPCSWQGIRCSGGYVITLALVYNQLTGTIPAELGNLGNLKWINLNGNQLTGTIPAELGNLGNLTELELHNNQLTGTIPAELGNLGNLTKLYLSRNQLTGAIPTELGNLGNLTVLYLKSNQLTGPIPPELGNLRNLRELYLPFNQLTGPIPPELGNLGNLKILRIDNNQQLTGQIPSELGNLGNLTTLWIFGAQLTGTIPAELGNLGNLTSLSFNNNQLTGSIPTELGNLANLEYLGLYYNQLTGMIPTELGNLVKLKGLNLHNNRLTGMIPAELGNLVNLEHLGIYSNQLTGTIPTELGNLVNVKMFYLHVNQLTGPIPAELGNLENVTYLYLNSNQFSNSLPQSLVNLDKLFDFRFYDTDLCEPTDTDFQNWLAGISSLSSTGIKCESEPPAFCDSVTEIPKTECEALVAFYESTDGDNWKNNRSWNETSTPCSWYGISCSSGYVTELYLKSNKLTGTIPAELGNLSSLQKLNLDWNQLSGSIPESLGNLSNLHYLYLGINKLSGSIPSSLGMGNLRDIRLNHNQLSGSIPESLGNLSNLQDIVLYSNQLSGSIPESFGNLSSLQTLDLSRNQLNGSIPEWLGKLSNLQSLYLYNNQLSGSLPSSLGNLSNLESLSLGSNQLSGSIPDSLGNLSNLQSINLSNNQLSGSIPEWLGNLSSLQYIGLYYNQFSGSIPESLGKLSNLTILYLANNQLSGSIPSSLGNLSNLQNLFLNNNQLSGSIPESLGNLSSSTHFFLHLNKLCGDIPLSLMNLNIQYGDFVLQNNHLTASTPELITWLNDNAKWGGQTPCPTPKSDGFMVVQGDLTENGQPMPVGTTITFVVNDSVIGETTTLTAGKFNQNSLSDDNVLINQHNGKLSFKVNGINVPVEQIIPVASNPATCPVDADNITFVSEQTCHYNIALVTEAKWDGTIEGIKFVDSKMSGTQGKFDSSDESLSGETIYLKSEDSPTRPSSRKTDDTGKFSFGIQNAGTYRVWQRSNPSSNEWASYDNAHIVIIAEDGSITVDGNQNVFSVDFPIPGLTQADQDTVNQVDSELSIKCQAFTKTNFDNAGINDIVKIDSDLTITSSVTVKGICNNATLTVDTVDGDMIYISTTDFIANYGSVIGVNGQNSSDNLPSFPIQAGENPATIGNNANNGKVGTTIDIAVGTDNDGWACASTLKGTFYNEGIIQAGQGGSGYLTGGNGGETIISCAKTIIQSGKIIAGNGGEANGRQPEWDSDPLMRTNSLWDGDVSLLSSDFTDHTANYANISVTSGNGGQVFINTGESKSSNEAGQQLITTPTSKTLSGEGGLAGIWCNTNPLQSGTACQLENPNDDDPRWPTGNCNCQGGNVATANIGNGGDLQVYSEGSLKLEGTAIAGGSLYFEPSHMISGEDTYIEAKEDVVIFGGENWELILTGLSEGAINAGRDIILAVGEGGKIDLRGVSAKAFKAVGKLEIHSDTILLDEGVQLEDLIQAKEVVVGPNKILYHVILSGQQQIRGQPNTTVSISLTISNSGPTTDTYILSAVSELGLNVSGLPASIAIEGLTRKQLDLNIVLPAEGNDTITITATSQADPTVVATKKIRAIVDLPPVVEPDNVAPTAIITINPETGEAPLTVELNASASTDTDGTIASYKWTASDGQTAEGQNAELTFTEIGDYTITLEVTDDKGATNSATSNVKVIPEVVIGEYKASGIINDKDGNPIAGVTIQVGDKTVVTDAAGHWEIKDLAEGEYTAIASKAGYQFDSKPCVVSNNVKVCQPSIKGESLLEIKVVPEPRVAKQGENVTYTITVTNQGEETATGVTLADVLPDNTDLVSIESLDGGSCEAETVTCSLPDLTPGATANVKVVISNRFPKTLINTVTVSTQEYPTDLKKTWTRVIPYLSVSVTDQPDPIEMLNVLHYNVALELSHNAPTDATGITLVSQLPIGVELKSINSDYAICDSSAFPQITCEMNDLSIASADSVSQATVEMDVELKDAGLLLLTHQAKVTANEYPAHSVRTRTTVFVPEDIQVDLALVIDVTGSMQEEINGIIKALKTFIAEREASTAPLMALLTFGDNVKLAAFTRDMDVLKGAIADLTASGGGLCEEASVEALLVAIPHTKVGGEILFATDASPYDLSLIHI